MNDDAIYVWILIYLLMFFIQVDDYLYILFLIVNSPLLLELSPCGQVQISKASRLMAQVSRALIRKCLGWEYCCLILSFLMYHLLNHVVEDLIVRC